MAKEAKDNIDFTLRHIANIKSGMGEFENLVKEAQDFYEAKPSIVKEEKDRSSMTTTDLMDEVQRIKPSLMEDISGSDDLFSLEPRREEVVAAVKNLEVLVNHQVKRLNPWFRICDTMIDDMLIRYLGVIKYGWVKDKRPVDIREFQGLDEISYQNLKNDPNVEIDDLTFEEIEVPVPTSMLVSSTMMTSVPFPTPDILPQARVKQKLYSGTLTQFVDFEGFDIKVVSPTDVGFYYSEEAITPESFFYHRLRYDDFEVEKEFGEEALKKIKAEKDNAKKADTADEDPLLKRLSQDLGGFDSFMYDEENQKWLLYECFYKNPDNGRPWRKLICGRVEVLTERNKYFKPPFLIGSPILKGHSSVGYCAHTLTKEPQKLRTFLYRQISNNLLQSNYRRYFGDPERLNLKDYLGNNNTNALIRTVGDPRTVVAPEEKAPIPPEVFTFAEQINTDKDIHGISPRALGGVSRTVVNRSFRGQNQQMQAASAKIQMIGRVIAETILVPLGREAMNCNIRFMSKETHLRYFHEYLTISPQNISDQAEVVVNIGLGTNSKDNQVTQLQQVLGLMSQALKMQMPTVTPANFYHVSKELLNVMGYKDTSNFLTDPKQGEAITQLVQMLMQMLPMLQQQGIQPPPLLMQAIQKVGMLFHVAPPPPSRPPQGQATMPGQQMPEQPVQPAQPGQPVTAISGGQFNA